MLVCSAATTKHSRLGGFSNRSLCLPVVEAGKSKVKVTSRQISCGGFFSWCISGCLLPVCLLNLLSEGGEREHEQGSSLVSLLTRSRIQPPGPHPTLTTLQRPHLKTPSHGGLGTSTYESEAGDNTSSVHIHLSCTTYPTYP